MSYNEVGWLPVRGLGAWPGACINSTSATSVRLSPTLPRSFSRSLRLRLTHPPRPARSLLPRLRLLPRSFFPCALHSLQACSGSSDAHTLLSRLPPSSRLDSSTLGAYESTQPDTTRRVRRSATLDVARMLEGRARGRTHFKKT